MASATPRNKLWATMNVSRTSREWKELQNPITSTVQIVKISNTALRLVMDFTITATMERVVVWPPEVISSTPLGEIRDCIRFPHHPILRRFLSTDKTQHLATGIRGTSAGHRS